MKQKEQWAIHWLAQDSKFEGVDEYHIKIWLAGFNFALREIAIQLARVTDDDRQEFVLQFGEQNVE